MNDGPSEGGASGASETFARRFLRARPDVRTRVAEDAAYRAWLGQFRRVEIDGTPLYVLGGDLLLDEDQVALEWARRAGMVSEDEVDRAQREE